MSTCISGVLSRPAIVFADGRGVAHPAAATDDRTRDTITRLGS